jgi:hypothetical protein|tara:strand:- start:713 stop:1006 length:294 start_codon:yes stop_codon:yes gene_type:complete
MEIHEMTQEDEDQLRRLGRYDLLDVLNEPHKSPADRQVGGNHYKEKSIQPWDVIDAFDLGFYEGNVLKYLLRDKGNKKEDLEKAIHYLEKIIEGLDK